MIYKSIAEQAEIATERLITQINHAEGNEPQDALVGGLEGEHLAHLFICAAQMVLSDNEGKSDQIESMAIKLKWMAEELLDYIND